MLNRREFVLGLGAVAAVSPSPARAAVARRLGLAELIGGTCNIVVGTPVSAFSMWERVGDQRRIVTHWAVHVEERLDDREAAPELLVRTLGGEVGDVGQRVAGEAPLAIGERGVLFLCELAPPMLAVFGWGQGYYRALGDGSESRLRASPGTVLVGEANQGAVEKLDGCSLGRARRLVLEELRRAKR